MKSKKNVMSFGEQSTKNIVEQYYKKYYDLDGNLEIQCEKVTVPPIGRSFVSSEVAVLGFVLEGKLSIGDGDEVVRTTISHDDVSDAFKTMLEEKGHIVKRVFLDYGMDMKSDKAVFNGVRVMVSSKSKVKK